jgi:hypothetical protein
MSHVRTLFASGAVALTGVAVLSTVPPALADGGGRPLSTALSGAMEVPGPGDPDGTGTARLRVNPGQGEICYELTVSGIDPARAAHIHEARTGAAGPVVVTLAAPTSGSSSACVSVRRELAREIVRNPEDYYVNVHNVPFPAGALRGQLG